MYNTAIIKQVFLTRDIKWNGFYGANVANNPILFNFTEGTGKKTNIR